MRGDVPRSDASLITQGGWLKRSRRRLSFVVFVSVSGRHCTHKYPGEAINFKAIEAGHLVSQSSVSAGDLGFVCLAVCAVKCLRVWSRLIYYSFPNFLHWKPTPVCRNSKRMRKLGKPMLSVTPAGSTNSVFNGFCQFETNIT